MRLSNLHILLILAFQIGSSHLAQGMQPYSSSEYEVKAAFLYNFTRFVSWPSDGEHKSQEPFVIGIFGRDPFGDLLEGVVGGKTFHGRKIDVHRYESSQDLTSCHILFICKSERYQFTQILKKIQGFGVLSVGDADNFTRSGGMIRLFVEENKVRFEINVEAAEQAGLKLSSKLLNLATIF